MSLGIHHPQELRRRAFGAYVAIALFMGVLVFSFFRIQVLGSSTWELQAATNRLRTLPIPAPRGTIYDRYGNIVADNVPGYSITILPGPRDSVRATLERMAQYVELSDERIDELMGTLRAYGREVVVDANAEFAAVAALEERRGDFPGVYVDMRPRRRYREDRYRTFLRGPPARKRGSPVRRVRCARAHRGGLRRRGGAAA